MKFERNKKYATIALYVGLLILFGAFVVVFFINYHDFGSYVKTVFKVLTPILYGVVIAYILNKIVKIFERRIFVFLDKKEGKLKLKRSLSVICAYIVFIVVLALFVWLMVPQVVAGLNDLSRNITFYIDAVTGWITKIGETSETLAEYAKKITEYLKDITNVIYDFVIDYIMPRVSGFLGGLVGVLKDLVVGIVLSVYFLLQKEKLIAQGKRFLRALLPDKGYSKFIHIAKQTDDSFGGYIVATAFDSLLVGIECFIIFGIFGIPYYPLVSLIVGVTNFIPFFGPFLGAIPSAFIIFIADPISVVWFIILVVIIQQIDGNFIMPKIVGKHIGLSSVWVVIAITIMSGLFGFFGMVFGVPIFSMIYVWIDDAVKNSLKKKSLPTEIIDYSDENGKEIEQERIASEEAKENRPPLHVRIKSLFVREDSEEEREEIPESSSLDLDAESTEEKNVGETSGNEVFENPESEKESDTQSSGESE